MDLFARTLEVRGPLLDQANARQGALRLFNGFYEGLNGLTVDIYAGALVIFNHADPPESLAEAVREALDFYRARLPWLNAGLVKTRSSAQSELRKGTLAFGASLPRRVRENGLWYALDLRLNQDASFYLDTRFLRAWLKENSAGLRVLNTFAYTGSLGTACAAGGAEHVLQTDLNRRFLNLAKDSYALNGLAVRRADFIAEDFYRLTARLRRTEERFDLVLLDPPLFSETSAGVVDLAGESARLINKLRPLLREGGRLVAVNNALFLSGQAYLAQIEQLSEDGFLALEVILAVPEDVTGYPATRVAVPPADPAPFNHPTKITVLRVKHK